MFDYEQGVGDADLSSDTGSATTEPRVLVPGQGEYDGKTYNREEESGAKQGIRTARTAEVDARKFALTN
jgi:hypothetical protein